MAVNHTIFIARKPLSKPLDIDITAFGGHFGQSVTQVRVHCPAVGVDAGSHRDERLNGDWFVHADGASPRRQHPQELRGDRISALS